MDSDLSNNKQALVFNPPIGSEYIYEFEDVGQVVQEKGKSRHLTTVTARHSIKLTYKIVNKSNTEYSVSVNFLSFEIENTTDVGLSGDMQEKDSTYSHRGVNSLKGAIFKLNVALDGKIVSISGFQEYSTRISTLGERPFDENFFIRLLGRITKLFPDEKLAVGSTWKRQRSHESNVEHLTDEYVLEDISDSLAKIRSSSQVRQQLQSVNTTLNGREHGEIEIETNTGMPRSFVSAMKLSGTCKIGGVDVAQSVVKTSRMIGNRIN